MLLFLSKLNRTFGVRNSWDYTHWTWCS